MTRESASISRDRFGTLPDGQEVTAVTLRNARGSRVRILSYGASVHSVIVPDRDGRFVDVALGHATLEEYLEQPQFFGATVGRVANRIAGGRFVLDGHAFQIPANNGPNALHGGPMGFDKRNWTVVGTQAEPCPGVTLRLVSVDGDQGFPGTLDVTADYRLDEKDGLHVEYRATTDRPTVVNLSNHSYWNLAGEGSAEGAMGHVLSIFADHYLPTDPTSIPTGQIAPVAGTPFDFRRPTAIGARVREASEPQIRYGRGYDHNWVAARTVSEELRLLARALHPGSGRILEVHSNQPGLQFYSGNFLDGTSAGKSGRLYRMGDAFALEPQLFPDTPNRPEFGSARLDPGQVYRNVILFGFSADVAEEARG